MSLHVDFAKEKEDGYKRIFTRSPLLSSMVIGWHDFGIVYDYYPPVETPEIVSKQHAIGIFTKLSSPASAERRLNGRFRREQIIQGDIVIVPANTEHQVCSNNSSEAISISIEPTMFARTVCELVDPSRVELLPHFATNDPLVYQMGLALKSALENYGANSRFYVETMIDALIVHLLQYYSADRFTLRDCIGRLPKRKLRMVIDYIDAHLDQDLGLVELATLVQMSPHYFSQLFKQSVSITPHQYVIHCRIERAKDLLIRGELTIAEVAKQVGFVDQSHLHRHFKRLVGITPKTFSRQYKK